MRVEQTGGTEQLQTFHSDEDYNEEYMTTLSFVDVQNQIFVKMQHWTDISILLLIAISLKADETSQHTWTVFLTLQLTGELFGRIC